MRVMAPGWVKHHKDLLQKLGAWHLQFDALRKDHVEEVSENMKIAALL